MIILIKPMWPATSPARASGCQTGSIRDAGKTDGHDVLESAPTDGGSAGHGTVLAMCPQVDWLRRRTRKVDISAAVRPKIVGRSHMTRPVRCPLTMRRIL